MRTDHPEKPQGQKTTTCGKNEVSCQDETMLFVIPEKIKPRDVTLRTSSLFSFLWGHQGRSSVSPLALLTSGTGWLLSTDTSELPFPPTVFSRVNSCEAVAIESHERTERSGDNEAQPRRKEYRIPDAYQLPEDLCEFFQESTLASEITTERLVTLPKTWDYCPFNFQVPRQVI